MAGVGGSSPRTEPRWVCSQCVESSGWSLSTFLAALIIKRTPEKLEASWPTPGSLEGALGVCAPGLEHVPAHPGQGGSLLLTPSTAWVGGWVGAGGSLLGRENKSLERSKSGMCS